MTSRKPSPFPQSPEPMRKEFDTLPICPACDGEGQWGKELAESTGRYYLGVCKYCNGNKVVSWKSFRAWNELSPQIRKMIKG